MRQVFTSPRLENVEGVSQLLTEAGIDNKVSGDRGYRKVSRREFSFIQRKDDGSSHPAVWVIKSEDYKPARDLLHGSGLIDATAGGSYVPETLQFKATRQAEPRRRVMRIKLALFAAIGILATWTMARMFFMT